MPHLDQESIESPVVSGVSVDRQVAKITISKLPIGKNAISKIFTEMGKLGVNVDIIIHQVGTEGKMQLGFTIGAQDISTTCKTIDKLLVQSDFEGAGYTHETDLAKVSVVGMGMRSHSGVASRTFEALAAANIPIQMISTSEIKISCVVLGSEADTAAQALHSAFVD